MRPQIWYQGLQRCEPVDGESGQQSTFLRYALSGTLVVIRTRLFLYKEKAGIAGRFTSFMTTSYADIRSVVTKSNVDSSMEYMSRTFPLATFGRYADRSVRANAAFWSISKWLKVA